MAKHGKKTEGVVQHHQKSVAYSQHEVYDDSFLPDAQELQRLKELDPTIIDWIKTRTEKEQDARIDFNKGRIDLIKDKQSKEFKVDITTLILAFLLICITSGMTIWILSNGYPLGGTVFGGLSIAIIAKSFLEFKKNKEHSNKLDK